MNKFRLNKYNSLNIFAYFSLITNFVFLIIGAYLFTIYPRVCKEYLCALDPLFYSIAHLGIVILLFLFFLFLYFFEKFFLKRKHPQPEKDILLPELQRKIFKIAKLLAISDIVLFFAVCMIFIYIILRY